VRILLAACAGISALVTVGLVLVLLSETIGFFSEVSPWEFLTETRWTPLFREKHFGILPLLTASLQIAAGAAVVSLPLGVLTAVFLSEYAGEGLRRILRPTLEVLSSVPTVAYGYLALTVVTPMIRGLLPATEVFNAASASVVLGIMVLPTVASLSERTFRAVPGQLREAAYGLGASRLDVTRKVVLPAGASGVLVSFLLALSRAFGETMVVTIAAGNSPRLTLNPLEPVQTMTAYMVQVGLGDPSPGSLEYRTLFAVAMALFLITMAINGAAQWARSRMPEWSNG
jgi:phosphate transport system permease protein